jgi:glycosyltransferase involved in cell wall biosynthesis
MEGIEINHGKCTPKQYMVGNKGMKILFISPEQYPNGGAATNRHLAYAKGLIELGHNVEFLLLRDQQWSGESLSINNIRFTCTYKKRDWEKNFKLQKISSFYKWINRIRQKLTETHQKEQIHAVVFLNTDVASLLLLVRHCRKMSLKIFHERTEYPFVVGGKTAIGKAELFIYLKYVIPKFDGIYVITDALKSYFSKQTRGKIPLSIINMIVDPQRFQCKKSSNGSERIITYCGTLNNGKDGVLILIKSFANLINEFPKMKLRLIGAVSKDVTGNKIDLLLKELKIENKVIITGALKRDEIPPLLCDSYILALARPSSKQAEGGFPTKLGEYLATGNLVVVTNVGEIGRFLVDKKNAFVSDPDSIEQFSQKLREALLTNNGAQIGIEGRKLAFSEFNYLTQAKKLEKVFLSVR